MRIIIRLRSNSKEKLRPIIKYKKHNVSKFYKNHNKVKKVNDKIIIAIIHSIYCENDHKTIYFYLKKTYFEDILWIKIKIIDIYKNRQYNIINMINLYN